MEQAREVEFLEATEWSAKVANPQLVLSPEDSERALSAFESFECWEPFFLILSRRLGDPARADIADYLRLAKIQYGYLEDVFAAAETCSKLVKDKKIQFRDLIETIMPSIFEGEDHLAEATFLQGVYPWFSNHRDKVDTLERLCLLFEKKTFNELQLNETYTKLLEIDPLNSKALRYFKLIFTQNQEWEKVSSILRNLIASSKFPRDRYRVAQELAAVLLYQLDQPREALSILKEYSEGSPLDTSTIAFEAYQRLADWSGCVQVLRECLLSLSEQDQRAVIFFRLGLIFEKNGKWNEARESFLKAIELSPDFLEALEALVSVDLAQNQRESAVKGLETVLSSQLEETVKQPLLEALQLLRQAHKR
jgi:tetratricopeptide (TPR) repeat protein